MSYQEKNLNSHTKVDPLSGITIDGFKYTNIEPMVIESFSPQLGEPFFVADNNLAQELQILLEQPEEFVSEFIPLSIFQQDSSKRGTRTIKGILQSHPEAIIVLSGLGVVRNVNYPPSGFIVESPHWSETVDQHMKMGHMQVSAEGNIWSHSNKSVFGAYDLADLLKKLLHTNQYSSSINDASNLKILLAGTHTESADHGWLAYQLPSNAVRTTELQQVDLMKRTDSESQGMYGRYINLLFNKIKSMHEQGVVHMELHPGNCYPILLDNGELDLVVTDWTTAQSLSELPDDAKLSFDGYHINSNTNWGNLSPNLKAIATDIYVALENAQLLSNNRIWKGTEVVRNYGVEIGSLAITRDMINLQVSYFAEAIAGYTELNSDISDGQSIRKIVFRLLNEIIIPKLLDEVSSLKEDWNYAGGEIDKMERPNYLMKPAFSMLAKTTAMLLASGKEPISFELVSQQFDDLSKNDKTG